MSHIPLIDELALLAAVAVMVSLLLARLRLPPVSGLIAAGILIGPNAAALVTDREAIDVLAEVGVVFLLFTVGLEFSLAKLRAIWRLVFVGGALQVLGTIAVVTAIAVFGFDVPVRTAVVYGFVFALSSTAMVLRLLTDRRELDAPHGRIVVGALILQDLCVVPMVLIVPILATGGSTGALAGELVWAMGKAALVVIAVLLVARFLVPRILSAVDASRSRDLFLLAVLAICIGTAWLTSQVGLSLALGAFLGGIVVADTEFGHRAMGDVLPLRDAFVSIFFVSLGMLLDVGTLASHPLEVLGLFAAFILGKGALATAVAMSMRFPPRVAWLAGVGLAQFGEFGFVVLNIARQEDAVGAEDASLLLTAGVLSMLVTPLLARMAPRVSAGERILAPIGRLLRISTLEDEPEVTEGLTDHVVIVGYGVSGRLVSEALGASGAPHVVLELNVETVRAARRADRAVFYGDASSAEVLHHAHLERASALVITIADPRATPRIVATARTIRSDLPILVRARYLEDAAPLRRAGARELAVEEVEVGVELVMRALRQVGVPRNVIESRVSEARAHTMQSDRTALRTAPSLADADPRHRVRVDSVLLEEDAAAIGQTLVELDVRRVTGAVGVALVRGADVVQDHLGDEPMRQGDVLYLAGSTDAIARAQTLLLEG
ncbi:MAG TPA: cation:proton antiporter [Sandaracinaceae bacterium LLY-WYZ-13_1]|nr:cation:proton antiporter [Sandaracinaceae bacterium LLY-WYZ-13_1]